MLSYQQTCRAAWVTTCGTMNNLTFNFIVLAKTLQPSSILFLILQKRFLHDSLFVVNK